MHQNILVHIQSSALARLNFPDFELSMDFRVLLLLIRFELALIDDHLNLA